ncbi:MutS-related protein [Pirellulaceae bacterium SH449]
MIHPSPTIPATEAYRQKVAEIDSKTAESQAKSKQLVRLRLATGLPGLLLIGFGVFDSAVGSWAWQLGLVLMVAFLAFATWYEYLQWMISRGNSQKYGFLRLIARCERDWERLPELPTEQECAPYQSDWTRDLDLFGNRSLFRWFSLAMSQTGAKTIAKWMTEWAPPSIIQERQAAVQELALQREWRLGFYEIACASRNQSTTPEAILDWARSRDHYTGREWQYYVTLLGPALVPLGLVILLASVFAEIGTGQAIGLGILLAGLGLNLLISMVAIGPIHDLFHRLGSANRELQTLIDWLSTIVSLEPKSAKLTKLRHKLANDSYNAVRSIGDLQRLMSLAGMQRSPLFFIPYVVLQILLLWDVRILKRLEKWKASHGERVDEWIDTLGEMEALVSAATLADEYDQWTFPKMESRGALLAVHQVAHPLLKDTQRVPNDLQITDDKRLLLVTGSNMAGKSTLLRSIGVNSVLARLGAPVCAGNWRSESFEIATSIRVHDSLQDGVSFFMAELKRLRAVVDQAQRESGPSGKRMLVLLDEILQGTNSRERQIAVDSVLKKLVDMDAIVLSSTHDLELASNEKMQRSAQIVHFREYFETVEGKQVMRFDYVMRAGVTPTTNALKLLEMVGL